MKKILILLLLLISIPLVKAEETEDLAPNAKSAIMIEASTGEILFQKNKDEKLAPASMTKMMSMLLIMEEIENGNLKWNEMITTSEKASSMGGSLYYNAKSGTCYVNQNNATTACNFTSTGIKNDTTKNIIAEVTYNTAGYNDATLYPNEIYTYERGSTVYSGRQAKWTGKIGLMYPSDYGYASDLTKCREKINNYNSSTCSQNNWIHNMGSLWLLTHDSASSNRSWSINSSGNASVNGNGKGSTSNGLLVFPSLFLSSNVKIISGTGSINNPYQLGV